MNLYKIKELEAYTKELCSDVKQEEKLGLWNGQMGIAVFLYHYSRITQNKEYDIIAGDILDTIYEKIDYTIPYDYYSGMAGIGAGIEYLIQNNFLEGDADEVLHEFDRFLYAIISSRNCNSVSIRDGICGLGYYFYLRLKPRHLDQDNLRMLKNKLQIVYIIDWLEYFINRTTLSNQEIYDIYLLLLKLYSLDIINFKVNKMINICLSKLSFSEQMYNNYEYLGVPLLKILKPWL